MDDISNKTPQELLNMVDETEDKEVLRFIANELEVPFSGNTGVGTLKEKLIPILQAKIETTPTDYEDEEEVDPVMEALKEKANPVYNEKKSLLDQSKAVLATMDPNKEGLTEAEKRAIVRAKALRLHRVRITNLDPNDAPLQGAIKTVYNKYVGKISKFIPYGEENVIGYHIPEILLESLREEKFPMRREVKGKNSSFGVKQYKTVLAPKFSIEMLPPLTDEEIRALAQDQKARGALDPNE